MSSPVSPSSSHPAQLSAIVPTLGSSPWLGECLRALRDEGQALAGGGGGLEIIVVCPAREPLAVDRELADRWIETGVALGFAAATNRGIAAASGRWIATINDDLVIQPQWAGRLIQALLDHPGAAAAQGVNLDLDQPEHTDGYGLGWNEEHQAVQLGHGEPPAAATAPTREVFGVSATAALYRRAALDSVRLTGRRSEGRSEDHSEDQTDDLFDTCFGSYYEDVDLACRLRNAGWTALSVPAARALHAGSLTGKRRGFRRSTQIYGNRHLVLARHLGSRYWPRLPRLLWRDCKDWLRAPFSQPSLLAAIPAGWARALYRLPAYLHRDTPRTPPPPPRATPRSCRESDLREP